MAEFQGFLAAFFRCALILGQRSVGMGGIGDGEGGGGGIQLTKRHSWST